MIFSKWLVDEELAKFSSLQFELNSIDQHHCGIKGLRDQHENAYQNRNSCISTEPHSAWAHWQPECEQVAPGPSAGRQALGLLQGHRDGSDSEPAVPHRRDSGLTRSFSDLETCQKLVSGLLSRFGSHLTLPWLEQPLFAGELHRDSKRASWSTLKV